MGMRKTFGASILALLILAQGLVAQSARRPAEYVDFLRANRAGAAEYILGLFETRDIVIICERLHPETTQWDLLYHIVSDPRFIARVGTIFTEYGTVNWQSKADEYLSGAAMSGAEADQALLFLMRNLSAAWPLWSNGNFYDFQKKLRGLNSGLPPEDRIRLYYSDIPMDWGAMTAEKLQDFQKSVLPDRDRIMARRIIDTFDGILSSDNPRKKALVVMNYRHAFGPLEDAGGSGLGNTGEYLFEAFPGRVANVLLNNVVFVGESWKKVHDGAWDSAFRQARIRDAGFDFAGSPFGDDAFDIFPVIPELERKYRYRDVFTGFAFYLPLEEHRLLDGYPGMLDGFEEELLRRSALFGDEYLADMKGRFIPMMKRAEPAPRPPGYAEIRGGSVTFRGIIRDPITYAMLAALLVVAAAVFLLVRRLKAGRR
jgi:hypothetical protein